MKPMQKIAKMMLLVLALTVSLLPAIPAYAADLTPQQTTVLQFVERVTITNPTDQNGQFRISINNQQPQTVNILAHQNQQYNLNPPGDAVIKNTGTTLLEVDFQA